MKNKGLEVVRGSGNVYRDFGHENADAKQLKALLAAEILKALDRGPAFRAPGRSADRLRGSGLLAYPQCRPGALHPRSLDVDPQPARLSRGSEGEGEAGGSRHARRNGLRARNSHALGRTIGKGHRQ